MTKKICKSILVYSIFYIFEIIIFSLILFEYRLNSMLSFKDFLYYQFSKMNISMKSGFSLAAIYFFQSIVEVTAVAVLTSYIFSYILHREPKILFPNKLVIRHRTSWESKNKITLGILIGNKSFYNIHNVVCSIACSYIKQEEPLLINSEFTLTDEQIVLENFYRFSFDLTQFPKQILKDIIEKPSYYEKETITVHLTGKSNYIGNSFKLIRKYKLSDIIFDEHKTIISYSRKNFFSGKDIVNPITKKVCKKIVWNEINKVVDIDEEKRRLSVKEIKYIIKNKKNNK